MGCKASRERNDGEKEEVSPPFYVGDAPGDDPDKTPPIFSVLGALSKRYIHWTYREQPNRLASDGNEIRAGMQRCVQELTDGRSIQSDMFLAVALLCSKHSEGRPSCLEVFTE